MKDCPRTVWIGRAGSKNESLVLLKDEKVTLTYDRQQPYFQTTYKKDFLKSSLKIEFFSPRTNLKFGAPPALYFPK